MLLCPTKLSGLLTRKLAAVGALPYITDVSSGALAFRTGASGRQIKIMYDRAGQTTLTQVNAQAYLELLRSGFAGRFQLWLDAGDTQVLGVGFDARGNATQKLFDNRADAQAAFVVDGAVQHWTVTLLG